MFRKKIKTIVSILVYMILLIGLSGCVNNQASSLPAEDAETITANCIIVHDIKNELTYKFTDTRFISDILPLIDTYVSLKERESAQVWALNNDRIVKTALIFDREQYPSWDEEIPEALCDAVDKIMTEENRVFCYKFLAQDPNKHSKRMEMIATNESAQFVTPGEMNFDSYYPSLTLYYYCYNSNLSHEREKENDVVFDETVDWLKQQNMVYKVLEPTLSSYSPNENYYSRRIQVLLNDLCSDSDLNKIVALIESSTSDPPFVRPDDSPSGQIRYDEPKPYTIYMITQAPMPIEDTKRISLDYDIAYTDE